MAARSLGLLGDTRAIQPFRYSRRRRRGHSVAPPRRGRSDRSVPSELEVAGEYTDDRAYLVQAEAEKAAGV